jgi:hypothetical protein
MQIYERAEFFAKSRFDQLYRFNAIRRMFDGKFHILSCDPISSGDDKNSFLEREGYVFDMLSTKGEPSDDVFFTDIQEAIFVSE